MSILNREQLIEKIRTVVGDITTDSAISLLEDLNDTIDNYEEITKDTTNYKEKCEQIDKSWREKYTNRFYSAGDEEEDPGIRKDDTGENLTFDKLFKTE